MPATSQLTYLGHDDRCGYTSPPPSISKLGGVASGWKKLAIVEAK